MISGVGPNTVQSFRLSRRASSQKPFVSSWTSRPVSWARVLERRRAPPALRMAPLEVFQGHFWVVASRRHDHLDKHRLEQPSGLGQCAHKAAFTALRLRGTTLQPLVEGIPLDADGRCGDLRTDVLCRIFR
jgi:hypothetical protein